jgi:hypothetical protein
MFLVRAQATLGTAATVLTFAVAALAVSCGGDGPESPSVPGDSGVIPITGGERLGWVQPAPSVEAIRAHSFRLFVDGAEASMADSRCSEATLAEGFECSGRLPTMSRGTHTLEVMAVWNGQPSSRSAPLTVMMGSGLQTSLSASSTVSSDLTGVLSSRIAEGLSEVSALAALPDGRLLLVEGGRAIRVVEGDALLVESALTVDGVRQSIVGMAVDSAFDATRAVYVATAQLERDGSRTLSVTRYRELANRLGQGATIVTGLGIREGALAPLGVDDEGLVYLANDGLVMRYARDGTVPATNPRSSPIVASGFDRPAALAVEAEHRRVWIAGTRAAWRHSVAVFSMDSAEGASWPQQPRAALPADADPEGLPVSNLSVRNGVLSVIAAGVARRSTLAHGAPGTFETLRFGAPGRVVAVTDRPDGGLVAAVRSHDNTTMLFQVPSR